MTMGLGSRCMVRPSNDEPTIRHTRFVGRANCLFQQLSEAGTERVKAGNRKLLFSQYASLILLSFFNPAMQTLRGLQTASAVKSVQHRLAQIWNRSVHDTLVAIAIGGQNSDCSSR